jgi:KDO2-lipid IV(A) lauroyltransferase
VEPVKTKESESEMKAMRSSRGLNVIPLGRPMRIGRALRSNEVVFFVADRSLGGDGVELDFFSKQAVFPRGPAYWSLKTGAPIVMGFCVREGSGFVCYAEPAMEFEPCGDIDRDIRDLTKRIVEAFETHIARHPCQWCMLQPVWGAGEDGS